jgi:hypothetical protein
MMILIFSDVLGTEFNGAFELSASELGSFPGSSGSNPRCPLSPNPRGYFDLCSALPTRNLQQFILGKLSVFMFGQL